MIKIGKQEKTGGWEDGPSEGFAAQALRPEFNPNNCHPKPGTAAQL